MMIIQTKNGKIRGFENESVVGGEKYFSFFGIPYAKPPTGDLRFSAPAPPENWDGIYDATYARDQCCQMSGLFETGVVGSDDCLYLNIHTPEVNPTSLKPVLFYIHGGGFFGGSGDPEFGGPDYLIHHDVILVTINYRVHILGFLNLEIPECPGNAGLKDQVMALKWVIENITAFGGDPHNITINGCSSGGSSVNFLMISPLATGLFQKAIIQCGTALSSWSLTYKPLKWAFKAARKLGFAGDDRLELLNFFRTLPVGKLAAVANELMDEVTEVHPARALYCPFSPSVEAIKDGAFLPDFPKNLVKTATPIPCITGYAYVERVFRGKYITENIVKAPQSMMKEIIKSNFIATDVQVDQIEKELNKFYFEQNGRDKSGLEIMEELLSDISSLHFYDSFKFLTKSNVPAYVFYFTYYTPNSAVRKVLSTFTTLIKKAYHGEEQGFTLFCKKFGGQPIRDGTDAVIKDRMCQLWVNFMRTGNPTSENTDVTWKPHTLKEPCYLEMDIDFEMRNGLINEKRIKFLTDLLGDIELMK